MADLNDQNDRNDEQDFRKSLTEITERQNRLLEQQESILQKMAENSVKKSSKDHWDRLSAVAPILSATIIALGGTYFTVAYNKQQLRLQEVQTIEKFIPHLLGDEKSKRAAILAISSIADDKLAAKVAGIFVSPGTVSALESLAAKDTSTDKKAIKKALASALGNLADTYRMDKRDEDAIAAYKRAIDLQEQTFGKNSPEVVSNLNSIAELCVSTKNYLEAESYLTRAAAIQKAVYGADSLQYAAQLHHLAALYKEEGLDEKAQSYLAQANEIERKFPGTKSDTATAAENFATSKIVGSNSDEAASTQPEMSTLSGGTTNAASSGSDSSTSDTSSTIDSKTVSPDTQSSTADPSSSQSLSHEQQRFDPFKHNHDQARQDYSSQLYPAASPEQQKKDSVKIAEKVPRKKDDLSGERIHRKALPTESAI